MFLYPDSQDKAGINLSFSHKAPGETGELQLSHSRATRLTRRLLCTHIFSCSCHSLTSSAFSQHIDNKQGQDYLTTFPLFPGSPWLYGFRSWLQLSAVLSARNTWGANTKQVMLEVTIMLFCLLNLSLSLITNHNISISHNAFHLYTAKQFTEVSTFGSFSTGDEKAQESSK